MSRRPLCEKLRQQVLQRDDYTCAYCQTRPEYAAIRIYGRWQSTLHVDHMIPVSRGGQDDIRNLVTACATCNLKKHNRHWPFPIAYCAGCGELHERPWGGLAESHDIGHPVYVCERCERRLTHFPDHYPDDEIAVEIAQWDHLAELAGF